MLGITLHCRTSHRKRDDGDEPKKYGNEKPISLYPLTPEEALRRAMSTPPPKKPERAANRKAGKDE